MIRFWIAIVAVLVGLPVTQAAEDLPAPKPRAADVPAPPAPQLPALQMPLPEIGDPAKPAEQPKVVAPSTLFPDVNPAKATAPNVTAPSVAPPPLPGPSVIVPDRSEPNGSAPNSAFPQPAPSSVVPFNPNPNGTTPPLPGSSVAPVNTPNNNVPNELKWRYKWHNGQWWYWSPDERWMIWDKNSWSIYDPATYRAPAGFAKPGPRVVTQQSTPTLPENYSGAEVSTPGSTYIQPAPYAFGANSYYGINGPASSYYNRGSATGLTFGGSSYVPVYQGYFAPRYISTRYTAPVGAYPIYGGRSFTIGFGF